MRDTKIKFPWRAFSRVMIIQAYVLMVAFGVSAFTARHFFKKQFGLQLEEQLHNTLSLVVQQAPRPDALSSWCRERTYGTPYELTLRSAEGEVLCTAGPADASAASERVFSANEKIPSIGLRATLAMDSQQLDRALSIFDAGLFVVMLLVGGALGFLTLISSRRIVVPLGELLLKARLGVPSEFTEKQTGSAKEASEWVELETALDRIQNNLKQQTDTLSREREELATLMSAISDAILAVDIQGKPLFFNSRFALLFFDKESRNRQPHLGEIFRTPEVLQAFHGALEQGVNQVSSLQLYVKSDPTPRYFMLSISPLRREVGPVYGAVAIFHDVTELKLAEKIRIDFVANVSHELRTPLTAIKGYTDTLREDVSLQRYDSAGQFLEVIARNVDRLMRLIVDLLDLSSLESQEAADKVTKSRVDTRELTSRVLAQLEVRRTEKNHTIEASFASVAVDADPARLEQVLINLLENAIKYVPTAGLIRVSWESDKQSVFLKVSDNGPGIPLEHHSRLFERFYRVDQARSRQMGGTGLGLAIVKHIMQRHGGSVWISNETGKGTEFICQFPMG